MFLQPYQLDELEFAWCYRVYYRWRTHRARSLRALATLDHMSLDEMLRPYGIHLLEFAPSETDVKLLVSLLPHETVSACAGKAKGRLSKWLREELKLADAERLFSRGYFACTAGPSTAEAVAGTSVRSPGRAGGILLPGEAAPRDHLWVDEGESA